MFIVVLLIVEWQADYQLPWKSPPQPNQMHLKINRGVFLSFSMSSLSLCSLPPLLLSLLSLPTSSLYFSLFLSLSFFPSLSVQFVLTKTCLTVEVLSRGEEEDQGEGRTGVVEGKRERWRGEGQE